MHYVYIKYVVLYSRTQLPTSSHIGPPLYKLLNHLLTMREQLIKIKTEGSLNYMGLFDFFLSLRHRIRNTIQLRLIDFRLWEFMHAFRSHTYVMQNVWSLRFGLRAPLWFSLTICITIILPAFTELILKSNAFNLNWRSIKTSFYQAIIIVHFLHPSRPSIL